MIDDDPGTVGANAPTDTTTNVIRPDDLEFEVVLDDSDDASIPFGLTRRDAQDGADRESGSDEPTGGTTAGYRRVPPLPDEPSDAGPPRPAITAGVATKVHVTEPSAEARPTAPRARAAPRGGTAPKEDSGSRYALATRGGESTVVAPRRPVVVPGKR